MNKKLIVAAVSLSVCLGAMAEGYQVNSLSARQIGMGHTGVALNLGAESMFFNPGALGFMNKTFDLSGSVTATMPTAYCTYDGTEYKTDAGVSTPLGVHAAFSIYDNLKAGISVYTPYGSKIDWTENWPGAVLNQNVNLKVFTVQPTVSWQITPKLSVGAGLMVSWGCVDLSKGLVSAEDADQLLKGMNVPEDKHYGHITPASVNLNGKSELAVGVNVGVMYTPTPDWGVGVSFRSKMGMKVKAGTASVSYNGGALKQQLEATLNGIHQANFSAEMPCPWVLGFGVSYKGIDRLTLAFDARLTGWNAYKSLDIDFDLPEAQRNLYNQYITKAYKNSWCFSAGSQYAVTNRFDARLGLMIDTTPVSDTHYNPETPGMTKIEPTIGFSFRPIPSLSIDFGFMYVHGCGKKNASVTYKNSIYAAAMSQAMGSGMSAEMAGQFVAGMGIEAEPTFRADYKLHAFSPSIGFSYSF